MNCTICECGAPLSNLGHECTNPFGVAAMLVFVPTVDSAGLANGILKTQTLDKTYFDSMTNHADPTKRWYPSPKFKNVVDTRAEAKFWEADDQSVEFVSEAARKFMALITQKSGTGATAPAMKKQIDSARCSDGLSVFIFSEGRQILVKDSADGLSVLPIEIDAQSVYAGFVKSTKDQNQHLALSFNFAATEDDGNLKTIECSEIDGYDILTMRALLNGCYILKSQTVSTLKIQIVTGFGSAKNPVTVDGLVVGDFKSSKTGTASKIYNQTDNTDVTITSVTESPDGTYLLGFAAQTLGDVLIPYAEKTGYDFYCMKNNPVDVES